MAHMIKIAVLTNELPPYRRPVFDLLGRHEKLDVTIYLSTRKEPHRLWNPVPDSFSVRIKTVSSFSITLKQQRRERLVHFPIGALGALLKQRPHAVISGEFGFRTLLSAMYCFIFRKPLIIWSEETILGASTATVLQQFLRHFLSRMADGFLAWGQPARIYLHTFGISDDKISLCAQAVDNDYWNKAVHKSIQNTVYYKHGLSGRTALFVGNLLRPKGVHHLIEAWALMPKALQRENTLLLVGDGSEKARLEALVESLSAQNVVFAGPVPHGELPAYYAAANFFVFPTLLDVWGLVVNEAMASGLPVLCSKYAGCAEELIIPGQTGDVFDPADTAAFSELLAQWLQTAHATPDPAIQAHIQRWNFESSVNGILEQLVKVGILSPGEAAACDSPLPKRSGSS